jgi:hypothetical protein
MDVCRKTGNGSPVGEGNTKGQKTTEEGKQKKEVRRKAMKKLFVAVGLFILCFVPYLTYGASNQVYVAYGRPVGIDNVGVLTDTAETLPALVVRMGGTWQHGNNDPVGVLIATETNGARIHFTPATPTTSAKGIPLDAGTSAYFGGEGSPAAMKIVNKSAGSNASVHIVLYY